MVRKIMEDKNINCYQVGNLYVKLPLLVQTLGWAVYFLLCIAIGTSHLQQPVKFMSKFTFKREKKNRM